ncbi:MAG: hydroxyisourate hydrolase [Deltaproteobacteria bacterium]|jgi:5-hydroxyisourate hydrolase|nr:MAG: hydroxyisourate hydrolase [Deltaproteobacteria bacterium]
MSGITTHVLDTAKGKPGKGIQVTLEKKSGNEYQRIGGGKTNDDGRLPGLLADDYELESGIYRISFDTGSYYKSEGLKCFYPEASIVFEIENPTEHFHVPLLISGYGYSTYRGS